MGSVSLNEYINRTPRGPPARLNPASPQEETFHLSLCKGIYDPKRTGQKACSPLPGREELLPCCCVWDRQHQPPRGSSFFGIRKSKAPSGFPFAIRKTPWNEDFSQTPLPLLILAAVHSITIPGMASVGCKPLSSSCPWGGSPLLQPACAAQPWLQLLTQAPNCSQPHQPHLGNIQLFQRGARRDVPVRFFSFFGYGCMEVTGRLWWNWRNSTGLRVQG